MFQPGQHLLHTECRGSTAVGGNPGTMVVRIVQNDRGSSLPPDLVDAAPSFPPRAEAGELVTLTDMEHFVEGNFDADPDWVGPGRGRVLSWGGGRVVRGTGGWYTGTPRAGSSLRRWTSGTHVLRFWSFRGLHGPAQRTAAGSLRTTTGICTVVGSGSPRNPKPSPSPDVWLVSMRGVTGRSRV